MKTTMKYNEFTFEGSTYYTNEKGNYFYCIKAGKEKADRIPQMIYDEAKELYDAEREMSKPMEDVDPNDPENAYPTEEQTAEAAQAELDKDPCFVDPMADLSKPAVINQYGCVDCSKCKVPGCVHRDCMRRNPTSEGGLGECPRLSVKVEEEETPDAEIEQIKAEIPGIEDAEAELERNIRTKKASRKPRRSKDIAYEGNGVTLTAKQVDFIRHLPDTYFWENGVKSSIWVDCLCDDIGGQFAGKPMTVGAMISTLCEKGLGSRCRDESRHGKPIAFDLSDLGQKIAKELGLE